MAIPTLVWGAAATGFVVFCASVRFTLRRERPSVPLAPRSGADLRRLLGLLVLYLGVRTASVAAVLAGPSGNVGTVVITTVVEGLLLRTAWDVVPAFFCGERWTLRRTVLDSRRRKRRALALGMTLSGARIAFYFAMRTTDVYWNHQAYLIADTVIACVGGVWVALAYRDLVTTRSAVLNAAF